MTSTGPGELGAFLKARRAELTPRAVGLPDLGDRRRIDGASHVDLYDKHEFVGPAVEELVAFYTANLTVPELVSA